MKARHVSLGGDECQVEAVLDKVIEKPFTMSFPTKEPTPLPVPANNFVGKAQQ